MRKTREVLEKLDRLSEALRVLQPHLEERNLQLTAGYIRKARTRLAEARTELMYAESHLLQHVPAEELDKMLQAVIDA